MPRGRAQGVDWRARKDSTSASRTAGDCTDVQNQKQDERPTRPFRNDKAEEAQEDDENAEAKDAAEGKDPVVSQKRP